WVALGDDEAKTDRFRPINRATTSLHILRPRMVRAVPRWRGASHLGVPASGSRYPAAPASAVPADPAEGAVSECQPPRSAVQSATLPFRLKGLSAPRRGKLGTRPS